MKKLTIKLLVLGLSVVLCCYLLSWPLTRGDAEVTAHFKAMPERIQIANTGSSHGANGLNYDDLDQVGFNFALSSQSIEFDYNLIDYYIDRFEPGAVVLIELSYFTYWGDETEDAQYESKKQRYYGILDMEHMGSSSLLDYYVNKYFYVLPLADNNVLEVFDPSPNRAVTMEDTNMTLEQVGQNRARYHQRHIMNDDGTQKPIRAENVDAFKRLIELCQAQGLKPVIFAPPYLDVYARWFTPEMLEPYERQTQALMDEYGVPFLDYARDVRFAEHPELFRDTDHLNTDGAKLLTSFVIQDLGI